MRIMSRAFPHGRPAFKPLARSSRTGSGVCWVSAVTLEAAAHFVAFVLAGACDRTLGCVARLIQSFEAGNFGFDRFRAAPVYRVVLQAVAISFTPLVVVTRAAGALGGLAQRHAAVVLSSAEAERLGARAHPGADTGRTGARGSATAAIARRLASVAIRRMIRAARGDQQPADYEPVLNHRPPVLPALARTRKDVVSRCRSRMLREPQVAAARALA
jgi:hypothetical protein